MKRFRRRIFTAAPARAAALLTLHLFVSGMSPAQDEIDGGFNAALILFEQRRYEDAALRLESLCERKTPHPRSEAACIMCARAWLMHGDRRAASTALRDFLERFPESPHTNEAHLLYAEIAVALGDARSALRSMAALSSRAGDPSMQSALAAIRDTLLAAPLTLRSIDAAFASLPRTEFMDLVYLHWAGSAASRGDTAGARSALERVPGANLSSRLGELRRNVLLRMGEAGGDLKICIALPTAFGDMERSVVVRDIRDGIVTALDVHYASGGVRVEPEFLYASSIDTIRHVFTAMARDQRFVGILGGIFSADAAVVAKAAAGTGLPCLVPAATADDLAEIADNVVQLNTTFRTRGVLLADYVFSAHRNASVGVLAPLDDVSRALTEAFIDRAKDLALRVEAVSWYAPGTNDLRSAYKALAERMSPYDTSSLLLVPTASRDNITALLKGYRQAGLKAKLLGAGDWNDPELLLSLLREDMRMEFESDYAVNTGFSQYRDFRSSYLKRTGREPGRDAVFGYDAARFFLNVISLGSYHREDLLRRMRRIWLGLRSPIDLRHGRSNRGLNIMRFSNGRIMRIATIPDL